MLDLFSPNAPPLELAYLRCKIANPLQKKYANVSEVKARQALCASLPQNKYLTMQLF